MTSLLFHRLPLGFGLLIAAGVLGLQLEASQAPAQSYLFVDHPIQIPGVVLEPGTYVFRRLEGDGKRKAIEVLNKDESHVLQRLTAIPDHRLLPEDGSEFVFHEAGGEPPSLRTWYVPGDRAGLEFVYPRSQAHEIAQATGDRVVAGDGDRGEIVAVNPTGKEVWLMDGTAPAAPVDPVETAGAPEVEPESELPVALPATSSGHLALVVLAFTSFGGMLCARWKRFS